MLLRAPDREAEASPIVTLNAGRPGIGEAERSVRFARTVSAALSVASNLPIDDAAVAGLIDPDRWPSDALFARAWRETLAALSPKERVGRLGGVTGHIGESVVEVILEEIGYSMLWHFTGPFAGGHGVDLLVLSPDGNMLAVEVKATLRAGRWPRPSRGELTQMTGGWLDKADNPGMADWDLGSDDVYGAVAVVNLAAMQWRCVLTADFMRVHPLSNLDALADLGSLLA
jgi:hypothetical protein